MRQFLQGILHPEIYHGFGRRPPFFEGWYFKLVSADHTQRWAVIPGIFKAEDPAQNHAFIQVLDGVTGHAAYHTYPEEAFHAHPERFEVRVGASTFSLSQIDLNIDDAEGRVQGTVRFRNKVLFPVSTLMPGIMGPFAWIPAMECYHGLLSLDHELEGPLTVNGQTMAFDGGRGYIEKDWGTNFPSAYIWQQSNHFSTVGTSLSASVAHIPLWGLQFPGFIIALWHERKLYRWATYTGAKLELLRVTDEHVKWVVSDRKTRLTMTSTRAEGGLLKAPIRTEMHRRVDETMRSTVKVHLETRDSQILMEDTGVCSALEVHGALEEIMTR